MDEQDWLAKEFEGYRDHLRTVAYRMLGSSSEADDAVQASWLRLSRANAAGIDNLGGWLTTVVARVCLDMLRSRKSRREDDLNEELPDVLSNPKDEIDPEHETVLADSLGLALVVVLETLAPDERLAFVLHDLFAIPFAEIAPIIGRTPDAARQLASRARRRVQVAQAETDAEPSRQRQAVEAFLTASRTGNFDALFALLDPDVMLRTDATAITSAGFRQVEGAEAVTKSFKGRARGAQLALINGLAGAVWAAGGEVRGVFHFTLKAGKIAEIYLQTDLAEIRQLEITILDT